jgi:hypothetical protein
MKIIDENLNMEEKVELLDDLQNLLEQQIELMQKGDMEGKRIEKLSERVNVLVEEVRRTGILETAQFNKKKEKIKNLYDCLYMAISARKDETQQQLNRLRKGKKTIVKYRGDI